MTEKENYKAFADYVRQMDPNELAERNKRQLEKDKADFEDFRRKFKRGTCKYCKRSLKYVNPSTPCLHWLLMPEGIKPKHLIQIIHEKGYFRIHSYLRWASTIDGFINNINDESDLSEEAIIHETIRLGVLEWTIICKKGDFEGHSGKINFPHFHIQLISKGRSHIKFNSEHFKLSRYDLFMLNMKVNHSGVFKVTSLLAPSAKTLFELVPPEQIIDSLEGPPEGTQGNVKVDTFIEANEGETLSGDKIAEMMRESKQRNVPIAALAVKYFPTAKIERILSPSDDQPENHKRN